MSFGNPLYLLYFNCYNVSDAALTSSQLNYTGAGSEFFFNHQLFAKKFFKLFDETFAKIEKMSLEKLTEKKCVFLFEINIIFWQDLSSQSYLFLSF